MGQDTRGQTQDPDAPQWYVPQGYQYPQYPQYGQNSPYGPYAQPQQPPGLSSLAVVAICLFWIPVAGAVLAICALAATAAGKATGRALAVTALVLGLAVTGLFGIGVVRSLTTPAADQGCGDVQATFLPDKTSKEGGGQVSTVDHFRSVIDQLDKAVKESGRPEVRAAIQAVDDDYKALLDGLESGRLDEPNLVAKMNADVDRLADLCFKS